ncbi:MAG: methyl-accepting chemotaxis protein [Candidatus Omnitrophica bacterium]|nr:methyl-accepting chemotaxis protein [Candidatus Omnitrophota bacterium]
MRTKNRRKRFLVAKGLQLHYVIYIVITLATISAVGMTGSYFGIWASVIKAFSEESLRESLVTAAQINEYEQARRPQLRELPLRSLRLFQETALLSERQKEIIRDIMDETHQRLLGLGALLLVFIGWGSIFLTHKIAGPIFKLGQYFRALGKGDLTVRIKFRKFDEIHYVADQFNEMTEALDARVGKIKRILRQTPPEVLREELKKELAQFKTTAD